MRMIQPVPEATETRGSYRDPLALLADCDLQVSDLPYPVDTAPEFPFLVPRSLAARIRPGDPNDPVLRQVLSSLEERDPDPLASRDPVGETQFTIDGGLIRKYPGRALLVTTGACAVHCRYCFRRHTDYAEVGMGHQIDQAVDAIRSDPSLHEIILSGGDPLSLSAQRLTKLIAALEAIDHVQTLRLHSRTLVVAPGRVANHLVERLASSRLRVVLVTHVNHPNELGSEASERLHALARAGVTLLNQAVLLQAVNDDVTTLAALSEALFANRVLPYYLHALDPVAGASHFRVPDSRALPLMQALRDRLPGYLVPRYVREVPGDASKRPVTSDVPPTAQA